MATKPYIRKALYYVCAFLILSNSCFVCATHFRFFACNWERDDTSSKTVTFEIQQAWRRTYFNAQLGGTEYTTRFYYGDGTSVSPAVTVTNVEQDEDWFIGKTTLTKTYASAALYRTYIASCCRISTLEDSNNDRNFRVETIVDLRTTGGTQGPTVTNIPIVPMVQGTSNTFRVPAIAAPGDNIQFSLTPAGSGGTAATVSPDGNSGLTTNKPSGLTLNSVTGDMVWTPGDSSGDELYAISVQAISGSKVSTIDFIIKTTEQTANLRPTINIANGPSPPPTALTVTATLGTEFTLDIVGTDPTQAAFDNRVKITTNALPTGATLDPCKEGASSNGYTPFGVSTCTRTFRWSPQLGQTATQLVLTATDYNGFSSQALTLTIDIDDGVRYLYLSGIIRDFESSDADFAVGNGDASATIIDSTLTNDGKPKFIGNAASLSTISSKTSFDQWWTKSTDTTVYSLTLTNALNPKVFSFDSTRFFPLGNENRYFTYEIHAYITYKADAGNEIFEFKSSDDLWVFVNGQKVIDLGGVHNLETGSVNLENLNLVKDETYAIDIFYAHRGSAHDPGIQTQSSEAALCNVVTSGVVSFDFQSFPASTSASAIQLAGGASFASDNGNVLRLVQNSAQFFSGSAWYKVLQKVLNGFTIEFDYRITKASSDKVPEGFAVVIQRQDIGAYGGAGSGLGYQGIVKSIAIEFDTKYDESLGDPNADHVSVHTRYASANDASEVYSLANGTTGDIDLDDGATHNVRIEYIPSKTDQVSGALLGWIRTYIDGSIVPVVSAQIDDVTLRSMLNGAAYVGFTSASGDSNTLANVDILNWNLKVVPPSAEWSSEVAAPDANSIAGNTPAFNIQARDACRNPIILGGDGDDFSAQLTHKTDSNVPTVTASIADLNDGTYRVSYTPTIVGAYDISVFYKNSKIRNSPWVTTVAAGPATTNSDFSIPSNTHIAGQSYTFTVQARDAFNNERSVGGDSFSVSFSPNDGVTASVTDLQNGKHRVTWSSTVAASYEVYVKLSGADISGSPGSLSVVPAAASPTSSRMSGNALFTATAGVPSSFTIQPRDRYGNTITTSSRGSIVDTASATLAKSGVATVNAACTFVSQVWQCTYTANNAGVYTTTGLVNAGTMTPTYETTIRPGPVDAERSTIITPINDGNTPVAGDLVAVVIQSRDRFGNDRDDDVPTTGSASTQLQFRLNIAPANASTPNTVVMSYDGGGRFRCTYTPTKTSNTLTAVLETQDQSSSTAVGNSQSETVAIQPGIADATQSMYQGITSSSISAGGSTSFIVQSRDQYGNVRSHTTSDASLFDVSIDHSTIANVAGTVVSKLPVANHDGNYTIVWSATTKGTYDIKVRLFGTALAVPSPGSVVVTPGAANATMSTVSGLIGGVENSTVSDIIIQAKDKYGNSLDTTSGTTFAAQLSRLASSTNTALTISVNSDPNGQFKFSYMIPYYINSVQTSDNQFTIAVTLGGLTVQQSTLDIVRQPIKQSNAIATNIVSGTAGVTGSFRVRDFDDLNNARIGPELFKVLIRKDDTGDSIAESVAFDENNSNNYTTTFRGTITGTYKIRIFWQLVTESEVTKVTPYDLVVGPGAVGGPQSVVNGLPSTIVAGSTGNKFTITLRDKWGNSYTTGGEKDNLHVRTAGSDGSVTYDVSHVSNGLYDVSYAYVTAGIVDVSVVYVDDNGADNPIGGQSTYRIFVTPDVADAPSSSLTGLGTTNARAGDLTYVELQLRDKYGNAVDNSNQAFYLSLSGEADPTSIGMTSKYLGGGKFNVTYTATKSGAQQLFCALGTPADSPVKTVGAGATTVTVAPADLDAPSSQVTSIGTYTAGGGIQFTIVARDRFSNPVSGLSFRSNVDGEDAAAKDSGIAAITASGTGTYSVTYGGADTAGNYSFSFAVSDPVDATKYNTVAFPGNREVEVVPAITHAPSTVIPSLVNLRAGTSQSFVVQTKDQYGNLRSRQHGDSIQVQFVSGRAVCSQIINDDDQLVNAPPLVYTNNLFSYSVADRALANGGGYIVTFSGATQGEYSLNITVNQQETQIDCNNFKTFAVTPGPTNGTRSNMSVSATELQANTIGFLSIVAKDQYGNLRGKSGDIVSLGVVPTVGTAPPASILSSSSSWISSANSAIGAVVYPQSNSTVGTYTIEFKATKVGQYKIIVAINGEWIPIVPLVNITAGRIWSFGTPSISGVTAAVPDSYVLTGSDFWGNLVRTSLHEFVNRFTRRQGQDALDRYAFAKTSSQSLIDSSQHTVDFTSTWHGQFDLTISLQDLSSTPVDTSLSGRNDTQLLSLNILHATCNYETPSTKYRCPHDDTCVASYDTCNLNGIPHCDSSNPFACPADAQCKPSPASCLCGGLLLPCNSYTSHCVKGVSECPVKPTACPGTLFQCSTGECRASSSDCPSSSVCPPGLFLCGDARSCARSKTECDAVVAPLKSGSVCPNFPHGSGYRCRDGSCVQYQENCATPKSCGTGMYECPDGSCSSTLNNCPDIYKCYSPTSYRCADGSCRASKDDCPTGVTCPDSWVLCPDEQCAPSLSQCSGQSACALNTTRCPDGSCRDNLLLCSTPVTCPASATVLCPDGACVERYDQCRSRSAAELRTLRSQMQQRTCVSTHPVLCADGSCVTDRTKCTGAVASNCPEDRPVRCFDGSCHKAIDQCPTLPACPASAPVRCPDGGCSVAPDTCPSPTSLECGANEVRCPSGGCANSRSLCPTVMSCPVSTSRCADGSCRRDCSGAVEPTCPTDQITCPRTGSGITCASTLAQCPQDIVCPSDKPVRCQDATCAPSTAECPAVPETFTTRRYACGDGAWSLDVNGCGTPTTCPAHTPYRCYDGSCRKMPFDCPEPRRCPSATPHLCPDGDCVAFMDDCRSPLRCGTTTPVHCPNGECVDDVSKCADVYNPQSSDNPVYASETCPYRGFRCRNGACVDREVYCSELECPAHLPYRCPSGMCTTDVQTCENSQNGCPYYAPTRCTNGQCAKDGAACAAMNAYNNATCPPINDPTATVLCWDNTCARSADDCSAANTCSGDESLCHDKTCVDNRGSDNYCVSAGADRDVLRNACPARKPVRCADGMCSISAKFCTHFPQPASASIDERPCPTSERPILCASGECMASADQCPHVVECGLHNAQAVRCGDGSCRVPSSDNECTSINTCPTTKNAVGTTVQWHRCDNGRCVLQASDCIDDTTGCPAGYTKCTGTGECVVNGNAGASSCTTKVVANGCAANGDIKCPDGACAASLQDCASPSLCPASTPHRCPDGACVAISSSCSDKTGCHSASPFKCPDGSCAADEKNCATAANGCARATPVRCADGVCRKYAAFTFASSTLQAVKTDTCKATVVCPDDSPYKCVDGSCVPDTDMCRPVMPCPSSAPHMCSDLSCVASASNCTIDNRNLCPPSVPVRCTDGQCVTSLAECAKPVAANGASECSGLTPFRCFDGSCKSSRLDCIKLSFETHQAGTFNPSAWHANTTCARSYETLCADGACVAAASLCTPVSGCPLARPLRCPDGSCSNNTYCAVTPAACPTGAVRCPDGTCRDKCPAYDGCPLSKPYYCPSQEDQCVTSKAACPGASTMAFSERIAELDVNFESTVPPCSQSCLRDLSSNAIELAMNPATAVDTLYAGLAFDASEVARTTVSIPAGAIIPSAGIGQPVTLRFLPAPQSLIRDSNNWVVPSRQQQFGVDMSYASTVISAPFMCQVDSDVQEPFPLGVTVHAFVDPLTGVTGPDQNNNADICLAKLDQDEDTWRCVAGRTDSERAADPAWSESWNYPTNVVRGVVTTCGTSGSIYAFIQNPVSNPESTSTLGEDFWADNWSYVVGSGMGGFLTLSFAVYGISRLYRYRGKYHDQRRNNEELQETLEDVQMVGSKATTSADATEMEWAGTNPLMTQMHRLERQLQTNDLHKRNASVGGDVARVTALESENQNLQAELARLKAELEWQAARQDPIDPVDPVAAHAVYETDHNDTIVMTPSGPPGPPPPPPPSSGMVVPPPMPPVGESAASASTAAPGQVNLDDDDDDFGMPAPGFQFQAGQARHK
jgi:fibro-slime domain-containing protein